MNNFGVGIYFLTVLWCVTLMFCWVTVRTGHYIGKVSVIVSFLTTVILVSLPKGEAYNSSSANFYDSLFVARYAVLSILLLSAVGGAVYFFIIACLVPVETQKVRSFGYNNN